MLVCMPLILMCKTQNGSISDAAAAASAACVLLKQSRQISKQMNVNYTDANRGIILPHIEKESFTKVSLEFVSGRM